MSWSGLTVPRERQEDTGELEERKGCRRNSARGHPILLVHHKLGCLLRASQPGELRFFGKVSQPSHFHRMPLNLAGGGVVGVAGPLSVLFYLSCLGSLSLFHPLDDNSASLTRYDSLMESF